MTAYRTPTFQLASLFVAVFCGVVIHGADQTEFAVRKSCFTRPVVTTLRGVSSILSSTRPTLDTFVRSPNGLFRIHFNTVGVHAVDTTDNNGNRIPDYIDSVRYYMDYAYSEQVDRMKYRKPLSYSGDSTAWDVYVMEIGNEPGSIIDGVAMSGYYGLTYPVDTRMQECSVNRLRSAAFMVLDNNYSSGDSVTEGTTKRRVYRDTAMLALKVTIAHEFHHMIQYAYAADIPSSMINEMTSVWMEHRLFPESLDYLQYMKPLFLSSDTRYWTDTRNARSAGYAHAFFFQYLEERGRDSIVREMWNNLGTCFAADAKSTDPFVALDTALVRSGSSLAEEWILCLPLVYATGYRRDRIDQPFSNAELMPLMIPFNNASCDYSEPSLGLQCGIESFQFRLFRCVVPAGDTRATDTIDVLCTNAEYPKSTSVNFTVTSSRVTNSLPLGSTPYYYRLESTDPTVRVYDTVFFSNGFTLRADAKPFPQPYSLVNQTPMWFTVPVDMSGEKKVQLTVTALDGTIVHNQDREVVLDAERKVRAVLWDPVSPDLSSGVYIYTLQSSSSRYTGTFLVQP